MMQKSFFLFFILFCCENLSQEIKNGEKSGEKIVNGQLVTSREDFPYHVAFLIKNKNLKDFVLCGGKGLFVNYVTF